MQTQESTQSNHPPPSTISSIESEKLVIASCLQEDRADLAREVFVQISGDDFSHEAHKNIWQCRQSLDDAGLSTHPAAVLDMARKLGLDIGGAQYLIDLLRDEVLAIASDAAVREAAQRIKDLAVRRSLIAQLEAALEVAHSGVGQSEDLITMVADAAESARAQVSTKTSGPQHASIFVGSVAEQIERRLDGHAPENVVPTGIFVARQHHLRHVRGRPHHPCGPPIHGQNQLQPIACHEGG